MKKVQHIENIHAYNNIAGQKTLHPLVSVIDFTNTPKIPKEERKKKDVQALSFGFYAVFLKDNTHCDIRYGRNYYDYQEGTLIFIAPHQVVSIEEDGDDYQPSGFVLLFHPDLLRGTALGHHMKDYTFFSYEVYEALHLSGDEKQTVLECFRKIEHELQRAPDKHSRKLVAANIELLLNYSVRFYERQFITRDHANPGVVEKFEGLLNDYLYSEKPQVEGIPSVTYFAGELHLSANYFGDLIKKETGKTAQEYIQLKLLDVAKEKISGTVMPVNQVAYELGFKYQQHFTRFFKQHIGQTPNAYRNSMN